MGAFLVCYVEVVLLQSKHHSLKSFRSGEIVLLENGLERLVVRLDLCRASVYVLFELVGSKENGQHFLFDLCILLFSWREGS